MAVDDEFASYARARWHPVALTFVLLGAPPRPSARLATETLTRLHGAWREGEGWSDLDLDKLLATVLLATWRSDRSAWWREDVVALADTGLPGLEPALDALPGEDRARAALSAGLRLEPHEAAGMLRGVPVDGAPSIEVLRAAVSGVVVDPPDIDEIIASSRSRRRRRWLGNLVGGIVGVLVIGGLVAFALTRPPGGPAPPGTSVPATNPAPIAWYADGKLHLARATVSVDDVVDLVGLPGGAVVVDSRRRLALVQEDGSITRLGSVTAGGSFVVDPRLSLAGWIEPGEPDSLVVRDLLSGDELIRQSVTVADTRVVAFDNRSIYFANDEGVSQRVLDRGTISLPRQDLLDVADGARIVRIDPEHLALLPPSGGRGGELVGVDGRLSDDGAYAMTVTPSHDGEPGFHVFDVSSFSEVALPLPSDGVAVAATFAPGAAATFVLARGDHQGFELVTCGFDDPSCTVDTSVRGASDAPLLAR